VLRVWILVASSTRGKVRLSSVCGKECCEAALVVGEGDNASRSAGEDETVAGVTGFFGGAAGFAGGEGGEEEQTPFGFGGLEQRGRALGQIAGGHPDDIRPTPGEDGQHVFFYRGMETAHDRAAFVTLPSRPFVKLKDLFAGAFRRAKESRRGFTEQFGVAAMVGSAGILPASWV